MKKLSVTPKNPQHFVALCFKELKNSPEIREGHDYMKAVKEDSGRVLFECSYGFFWASKASRRFSKCFYKSIREAIVLTTPLDLPKNLLDEWIWEAN